MNDDAAATGHTPLGPGREFDIVRTLLRRWGERAHGIGDDAAVLDVPAQGRLVASIDSSVEDVHFRRAWLSLEEIGYRAATAALSDLAAMAAAPVGMLVALTLPSESHADAAALGDGLGEAARRASCPIVGGDTTRGMRLCLTIAVLGQALHPLRRSGARMGEAVYVTGTFGGPGAALAAWASGREPEPAARQRFARPVARVAEARWLAERGASAMIDISDGLTSDARHLAIASDAAIRIDLDRLPCLPGVPAVQAASSGEEYELLCAAPAGLDVEGFAATFGVPLSPVGLVAERGELPVTFTAGGRVVDLPQGYDHFSI